MNPPRIPVFRNLELRQKCSALFRHHNVSSNVSEVAVRPSKRIRLSASDWQDSNAYTILLEEISKLLASEGGVDVRSLSNIAM